MPQPATHYLVTRRAIPKEYWANWWDKYKPHFGLGSSAPDLFYFPLLPNLKNIRQDIDWEEIANPLHASRSYDMFCALLSKAKQNKNAGLEQAEKQFAFAFGYYCHVITDCIFHPYVYRSTGDHWSSSDFSNELEHKKQELYIDNGIFRKYYNKDQSFSRIEWNCSGESENLLDYSIALLLHESLQEIYPDCYPSSPDVNSEEHLVQQAYSALLQSINSLFEGTEIHLFGKNITVNTKEIRLAIPANFFTSPYPNCKTLDSYTPEDLFNYASSACRKVFYAALNFWEDKEPSAKDYFIRHQTHYLNSGNWNLDTGLPCNYNNYKSMRSENYEHYSFRSDELKQIYYTLQAEYKQEDFPSQ